MFYSIEQLNKVYKEDFVKWFSRIHIVSKAFGDPIPLKLNTSQKRILKELNNFSVVLKPRQIGGTTLMMALVIYFADKIKNSNHGVISYDIQNARWQLRRILDIIKAIPEEYGVIIDKDQSNRDMITFKHSGARIITGSGGAENPCLGTTMFSILATETPKWSQDKTAFMSFLPTIVPGGFCLMESTPYGTGNLYHEIYMTAKENPAENNRQFRNIFTAWWEVKDFRIKPPKAFSYTSEEKEMIKLYDLDDEQLWWRRMQLPGYPNCSQRNLREFHAWYPTDDESCWLETTSSPFNTELFKKLIVKQPLLGQMGEKIYENKNFQNKYFMGIDTSLGKEGSDEMAAVIIDKQANIVCVLHDRINYNRFMAMVHRLVEYWRPHCFVELTGGYGFRLYEDLRAKKPYGVQVSEFQTNEVSKQQMFNRIDEWMTVNKNVNDEELKNQIMKYNQTKKDNKDDVLMAFGMALKGMMDSKTMPFSITVPKKEDEFAWKKYQQENLRIIRG